MWPYHVPGEAETHHADQDVAGVAEGGENVVHQLLVPQPPLGLVIRGVVAVGDQEAGPRQPDMGDIKSHMHIRFFSEDFVNYLDKIFSVR